MPLTYNTTPLATWIKPRWGTKRMYRIYETQFDVSSYDSVTGYPKLPFNDLTNAESNVIVTMFQQIALTMSCNIRVCSIHLRNGILAIRFSIPKYQDILDVAEELCIACDDFYVELRNTTIVIDSYRTTLQSSRGTNWVRAY
jgi:hypothetical protein